MEIPKPAQTNSVSPNNPATNSQQFPTLPITQSSQVFIHPEHDQGSLVTPERSSGRKPSGALKPVLFLAIFLVFGVSLALIVFIFLPHTKAVTYATQVKEAVNNSSAKADKVNQSLDLFYKARTAQQDSNVTQIKNNQILAATDSPTKIDNIIQNSQNLLIVLNEGIAKNTKVKGFAVPASDPTKEVRSHRNLASDISVQVASEKDSNDKLVELANQTTAGETAELKVGIKKLEENTSVYLDQSQKTSDYFVEVSDASIELINLAQNLASLTTISKKQVEDSIGSLTALKSKFAGFNKNQLPGKIDAYNKDLVEMFTLLASYFTDIKTQYDNPKPIFTDNSPQYTSQLQTLAQRTTADEISFWQENPSLSRFKDLSSEHTDVLELSQKVHDKNYFFFLNWLGVN